VDTAPAVADAAVRGLDDAAVIARVRAGQVNTVAERSSRTVGEIVRANLLTRFNAILGSLLVVILVVGPLQDAMFGAVLVANAVIGIVQELRAKRTLDRLALLSTPRARVIRNGEAREIDVAGVVRDDVLEVGRGDQIVVDGMVVDARGLEIDESLLSGESEPVAKMVGDPVLSGSFVNAGRGRYRATHVGDASYARQLSVEARRFSLVRSELRDGINHLLRLVTWAIVPTAALLVSSQMAANESLPQALRGSVAGVGSMIPEGLVLLTSVAFAVGVVRLGRRDVLVQELAAIEGLARVDVVCLDKTGTITEPDLVVAGVEALTDEPLVGEVLGALAVFDPTPNPSLRALANAFPVPDGWASEQVVPFSSVRRWSAACIAERGTWVLGAPEVLLDGDTSGAVGARVEALASGGRRVLLLSRSAGRLDGDRLPAPLEPAALVLLEERIRPDATSTLRYFADQGVTVKLISGDHPRTVAAIASRVGIAVGTAVDASDLPGDALELAEVVERHAVFGRVRPHQKRAMIAALQSRGHTVAMTGDGVNDVMALKDADIGVAMGSGSEAARGVARIVLLDDSFAVLPGVVAEGRRVIANIERVANLFLTKTVYALLLALAIGVAQLPFPFFPRHLTIVSSLTIGIPAFFLALAPNAARARPGFVGRVLRFAGPAGLVAAAATFAGYALARSRSDVNLAEARTTATIVLFVVALWVLDILARPLTPLRRLLVLCMVGGFGLVVAVPWSRELFAMDMPPTPTMVMALALAAAANVTLEAGWRLAGWMKQHTAPSRADLENARCPRPCS
jgi:cation-transporting ATPase E